MSGGIRDERPQIKREYQISMKRYIDFDVIGGQFYKKLLMQVNTKSMCFIQRKQKKQTN